jgi:hypothetical protein
MAFNQIAVGVQNNPDSPNPIIARAGKQGEALSSELHGRYYEQTYRKNMYFAANQAVATTTVGLALTYTGLVISNPITSSVNAVLNKCSLMQSVIQATQIEAYAIATGFNATTNVTHTAALATHASFLNAPVGLVVADTSATLPTAPFYTYFAGQTASATSQPGTITFDLEGSIILPPGGYALWVTPAQASVAGLWFSFSWEEVPV